MSRSIFGFIFRYSKKEQILLLVMIGLSFPFLYFSLDLPKTIINKAIGATGFPKEVYGFVFDQIPYLLTLCGVYLALVFINGGFKYCIHVFQGILGERMLRRLRYQLIERVTRFPLLHFRRTSQGELVAMVNAETEPLGGFIGEAVAVPAFEGGTLLTIVTFMFIQDWLMGLAAVSLYPLQAYLIPKLQARVNQLGKERVRNVRKLSEKIGELVSGAHEVHAHDTSRFELADFTDRFGYTFHLRADIYRKKFMIKFMNNFLAQLTPFFFFSIGGYLVIVGDLTFGSLVAVLAAYKDMTAPWKDLLQYYQHKEDSRIKYEQLIEQFEPAGMFAESLVAAEAADGPLGDRLAASNLSWEEEGLKLVNGVSVSLSLPAHVALVGTAGSGRSELARLLGRQLFPTSGRIEIGGRNLAELPEAVTGRRIAYVGQESYVFSGTLHDTLLYVLKRRPVREAGAEQEPPTLRGKRLAEALRAGNSPHDRHADWVDYAAAGATGPEDVIDRMIEVLGLAEIDEDTFQIGLRRTVDPAADPAFAAAILEARQVLYRQLAEKGMAGLVEPFDRDRYNSNASVAENILFGTPVGPAFAIENLGENAYVLGLLDRLNLTDDFLAKGHRLAEMMVDIFRDLPPGHEFFERFSFISSDDLPEFQSLLRRIETSGLGGIGAADRARLIALPFRLIPACHHLGLVDEAMQARLLELRRAFADNLPAELRGAVQFFAPDAYNAASSIQDNILFGKIASDKAQSAAKVGALLTEVIDSLGLRRQIIRVGLDFEVGIAGGRLSVVQRQKLALARCLIRRPELLIVNEALSALDRPGRTSILHNLKTALEGRSLVWVDSEIDDPADFDHVLRMEGGRLVEGGPEARPAVEAPETEARGLSEVAELLAAIPLFSGLDRSKLKFLAFTSERLTYDAGQVVFRQGETGDRAYFVIDGEAQVLVETAEGAKPIAVLRKNEFFGELALLADIRRTATVRAATPLTALAISKDLFVRLVEEDPTVSSNVTRVVVKKLEGTLHEYVRANAMYDTDTSLPSLRLFTDRFKRAAARHKRHGQPSSLLTIDLGPAAAEVGVTTNEARQRLTRAIGQRLRTATRAMDTITFINDLELGVIVNDTNRDDQPAAVGRRMARLLAEPIRENDVEVSLGRHFTFAVAPVEDDDLEGTLQLCRQGKTRTIAIDV